MRLVARGWVSVIGRRRGGFGFRVWLLTVSIIVTRCIKVAKNGIQQRRAGLVQWARAGTGGAVVVGSNPAWIFGFFFFLPLSKIF